MSFKEEFKTQFTIKHKDIENRLGHGEREEG